MHLGARRRFGCDASAGNFLTERLRDGLELLQFDAFAAIGALLGGQVGRSLNAGQFLFPSRLESS